MTWYKDGLRFECTGCGDCCTRPGYVLLTKEDIERLGDEGMVTEHPYFGIPMLKRTEAEGCLYFLDGKCSIYDRRPKQCRTYPFWESRISSPMSWQQEAWKCEGIGHGRKYTEEEIEGLEET